MWTEDDYRKMRCKGLKELRRLRSNHRIQKRELYQGNALGWAKRREDMLATWQEIINLKWMMGIKW